LAKNDYPSGPASVPALKATLPGSPAV
jgi:hypothetical protein